MFKDFDHFNCPIGADGTPFEYYEAFRDYGIENGQDIGWCESYGGFWAVIGYDIAKEIYGNPETFTNERSTIPRYGTPGGRPLMWVMMDEPIHSKYRSLVKTPFAPPRVELLSDTLRKTTNQLIDGFIDQGQVDISQAFAAELPSRMTATLLGLPPEQGSSYRAWTHAMHNYANGGDEAAGQVAEMDAYFHAMLEERKKNLGDDMLSMLIRAETESGKLSDTDLYDCWIMLLLGGIDNTVRFISDACWRLAWDRELRRRLIANPRLIPFAIDEFLRFYSPAVNCRVVAKEVSIGGVTMEPDQMVMLILPVINRDPRQFENPDVFIPDRTPNRHLGLGLGIHRCLGAHLVKVETRVAIEELLRRIPEFELDHTQATEWEGGTVAGLSSVPIMFAPGGGSHRLRDGQRDLSASHH